VQEADPQELPVRAAHRHLAFPGVGPGDGGAGAEAPGQQRIGDGEMAVRRPKSAYALGEIHGVGPMKIEKYGERFLALLRAADETEAA